MKIVYIDMDGVLADFDKATQNMTDEEKEMACNTPLFFRNLEPMPGALMSVQVLLECSPNLDVYVCSTSPWDSDFSCSEKKQWLKEHFPRLTKRLILTHRKDLCIGDYLIDDRVKHGVDKFQGEHILFGSKEFPTWSEVLMYILKQNGLEWIFQQMKTDSTKGVDPLIPYQT